MAPSIPGDQEPYGICVHAISPSLLPLHRILYYLALFVALIYPRPPPLVKGAFAYSLTQSAIAALYAIILAIPSPAAPYDQPQNLDVLPLWSILSTAAISLPVLLDWNRNLALEAGTKSAKLNALRTIIKFWGILITIGTAAAFVNIRVISRIAANVSQSLANPQDSEEYLSQSLRACQAIIPSKRLMRNRLHVTTMDGMVLTHNHNYERVWKVTPPLVFLPLAVGALACIVSVAPPPKNTEEQSPEVHTSANLLVNRAGKSSHSLLRAYLKARELLVALCPGIWVVVVVLNEIFLCYYTIGHGSYVLPYTEDLYEFGQWGGWAALGLAILAGVVNGVDEKGQKKRMRTDQMAIIDQELAQLQRGSNSWSASWIDEVKNPYATDRTIVG